MGIVRLKMKIRRRKIKKSEILKANILAKSIFSFLYRQKFYAQVIILF